MSNNILLVDPADDMLVALVDHAAGERVVCGTDVIELLCAIPAKHKFARYDFSVGQKLKMYGIIVGEATRDIRAGELITTGNLRHATEDITATLASTTWQAPEVSQWQGVEFNGYFRPDGRVGVRNYWIVVPLVYCQNRNLDVLRQAWLKNWAIARFHITIA